MAENKPVQPKLSVDPGLDRTRTALHVEERPIRVEDLAIKLTNQADDDDSAAQVEIDRLKAVLSGINAERDGLKATVARLEAERDAAIKALADYKAGGKCVACPNGHGREHIKAISVHVLHCNTCGAKWNGRM